MAVKRKTILLREQELTLWIGVHEHEMRSPQRLLISAEIELSELADEADDIAKTFDYDQVHSFIKSLESDAHKQLQETVARRVLDFVLSRPGVASAIIETRKPDIFTDCAFVGVRLEGTRS